MFHLFRSRKQAMRIMLGAILGMVALSMVVTLIPGVGSGTGTAQDLVLAEVGGEEVTIQDAQAQLQDYVRTQRVPPEALGFLAPNIVNNIISEKTMILEAERLGLGVTEGELVDNLKTNLPFLFQGGNFVGREQYAAFVQERFQKSIPEFEALLKKDMIIGKLRRLVTDGVLITAQEIAQEHKRRNEKVRIEYALVSGAGMPVATPSQAQLQEHFETNKASYVLPERRTIRYLVIDDAKVAAAIEVKTEELERYYNQNRDRFRVQERSRVTHILLKTAEKSPDEIKKVESKAQDVLQQVRAGKDFAELAKANSEDQTSAPKGGEIGWVTRGQTVPEFEQKAFTMKPGETSDLVKTAYGYHILRVLEREDARLKPFAEVQDTIRDEMTRDRRDQERIRLTERARAAALKHGRKIEEAGREVGLAVLTATIERGNPLPEAGAEVGLMDALFAASQGVVVGPVQMTAKAVVAVVADVAASRQANLPEVADRVKSDWSAAQARQAALQRAQGLAEKAKAAGGDLKKLARELKLETKTSEAFARDGSVPGVGSATILGEAFTAALGTVFGPLSIGHDQVVYKLIERLAPAETVSAEERNFARQSLVGTRQNEAFELYRDEIKERLKKQGKIKIYQERLDRFVAANRGGG